ncbi:unnamed protein product [Brassica napus]|uniref:(rape) hypothetical protein n=1 Tax=Brassica napus TaxID=3708 RepID=A0A816WLJ0_BRANA|nr:unnamed protein product [Brassica napus]
MMKGGNKLMKLKSVLKKLNSFNQAEPTTEYSSLSRSLLLRECISFRRPSHRLRRQNTASVPGEL